MEKLRKDDEKKKRREKERQVRDAEIVENFSRFLFRM